MAARKFTWTKPLWMGSHFGRELPFGGKLSDGSRFVALFTFESLAKRYITLDPDDDPDAVGVSWIGSQGALRQLICDVQESGWTHFVIDPMLPVVDLSKAIEIAGVVGNLRQWEDD
jgi:hypothetical protein